MPESCHHVLEPLRVLNRLWSDEHRTFFLFFAAPIDSLQFGFLQLSKPGQPSDNPYWETFRIYVVDDCYVKLNPVSQQRDFGIYDLKITKTQNDITFLFENSQNERERILSFCYITASQQLNMKAIGLREGKPYETTWTARPV